MKSVADMGRPGLSRDEVQEALARQLSVAPVPAQAGENPSNPFFPTRETLTEFYPNNGHRLAWCDDSGRILPSTRTLLDALRRAGEHGLDPEDYALSRLDLLGSQVGKTPLDDTAVAQLADFDLLMTGTIFALRRRNDSLPPAPRPIIAAAPAEQKQQHQQQEYQSHRVLPFMIDGEPMIPSRLEGRSPIPVIEISERSDRLSYGFQ